MWTGLLCYKGGVEAKAANMAAGKADVMTLQDRVNKIRKFTSRALVALPGDERGGSLPARSSGGALLFGYMDDDPTIHARR